MAKRESCAEDKPVRRPEVRTGRCRTRAGVGGVWGGRVGVPWRGSAGQGTPGSLTPLLPLAAAAAGRGEQPSPPQPTAHTHAGLAGSTRQINELFFKPVVSQLLGLSGVCFLYCHVWLSLLVVWWAVWGRGLPGLVLAYRRPHSGGPHLLFND